MKKVLGPSAVRDAAPSTIEVIASTYAVDRQRDRINPRGIRYENYLKNPTVLWAHDYTALPVGRALEVTASDRDLRALIQFGPHTFAQEVYGLYRSGGLNAVSIGFTPLEPEEELVFEFEPEPEPVRIGYPTISKVEPTYDIDPRWVVEQIARATVAAWERVETRLTGRLPD